MSLLPDNIVQMKPLARYSAMSIQTDDRSEAQPDTTDSETQIRTNIL